jgi:hypothetical protein
MTRETSWRFGAAESLVPKTSVRAPDQRYWLNPMVEEKFREISRGRGRGGRRPRGRDDGELGVGLGIIGATSLREH